MVYPSFDAILQSVATSPDLENLEALLCIDDTQQMEKLFSLARNIRDVTSGKRMVLRGLVEFSNYCRNTCFYCGLNRTNASVSRYRLSEEEILACAHDIAAQGIGTIVLQSGEDAFTSLYLSKIVEKIKDRYNLALTLSVGERPASDYRDWKLAGADRYLMRIESSDKKLYESIHQGRTLSSRIKCLDVLRDLGYQVGSGIMVGFPGQTVSHIAQDIKFFCERDFDMIGIGPFIPHEQTPFRSSPGGDLLLTLKTIALTRITTKNAWIPSTTALGSLDRDCRLDGLQAGANVIMPNFTSLSCKKKYEIYPNKEGSNMRGSESLASLSSLARSAELVVDGSRCDSLKKSYIQNL